MDVYGIISLTLVFNGTFDGTFYGFSIVFLCFSTVVENTQRRIIPVSCGCGSSKVGTIPWNHPSGEKRPNFGFYACCKSDNL